MTNPNTNQWVPAMVYAEWHDKSYRGEVLDGQAWNGWAIPRFGRIVAEQYVEDHNTAATADDPRLVWEGDTIRIVHDPRLGYDDEIVEPDADGMYAIGAWSWVWSVDEHADGCPVWDGGMYCECHPTAICEWCNSEMDPDTDDDGFSRIYCDECVADDEPRQTGIPPRPLQPEWLFACSACEYVTTNHFTVEVINGQTERCPKCDEPATADMFGTITYGAVS